MADIDALKASIDYESFAHQEFGSFKRAGSENVLVACFNGSGHAGGDDSTASLSFNIKNGLWKCHGCGKSGDVLTLLQEKQGLGFKEAVERLEALAGAVKTEKPRKKKKKQSETKDLPPIEGTLVEQFAEDLFTSEKGLTYLRRSRGLSDEVIRRRKIGINRERGRFTIPVPDTHGRWVNIRLYAPEKAGMKMISWAEGYGQNRLYPIDALNDSEDILICEGEWDALAAESLGFAAVTGTAGASSFPESWAQLFEKKRVAICYDCDKAGRAGAEKVASLLLPYALELRVVDLKLAGTPEEKDLTDFIVKCGKGADDLRRCIQSAENRCTGGPLMDLNGDIKQCDLAIASRKDFWFSKISFKAIIAGKDLAPFIVPRRVLFTCTTEARGDRCRFCSLKDQSRLAFDVARSPELFLKLTEVASHIQQKIIRTAAEVKDPCKHLQSVVQEAANIEELSLIPAIDFSAESSEYVLRKTYFLGHGLGTNQCYEFKGLTIPHPKSQYATHLIGDAVPSQDTVSSFVMTEEIRDRLKVFQPDLGQSIRSKFSEIHKDLVANYLRIYERNDALTCVELVYHSVTEAEFMGVRVRKPWLEVLVLGDTRCGKSELATNYLRFVQLGEIATGENASFAGLLGGMQQSAKRWSITWGAIPLNDRRLLIIDEASGISQEDISKLSGVRSSGVAEITKIQREMTPARTRLLWLSNPRNNRPLNSYDFGVLAVRELIGRPEDIARFDLVCTAASGEVSIDVINAAQHDLVHPKYLAHDCKNLILWAWSRKRENVKFEKEAEKLILSYAKTLGQKYTSAIPIVEAAEQRIKIARVSIAVAARMFSTTDGNDLVVRPEHVQFAYEFMEQLFTKNSLGYDLYSDARHKETTITDEEEVRAKVKSYGARFIDMMLDHGAITRSDLEDFIGCEKEEAKKLVNFLVQHRCVRRDKSYTYRKLPAFVTLMRQVQRNGSVPAGPQPKEVQPPRSEVQGPPDVDQEFMESVYGDQHEFGF